MTHRVLGVDPGLTRCGIGIIDVAPGRRVGFTHVEVVTTPAELALERRLLVIAERLGEVIEQWRPDAMALERVFAQHNLRTVMGTAQVSGVVLHQAARSGIAVGMHTPSEVKAAVTGYGNADKAQVGAMVARLLGLAEVPRPADAADALALAICHAWRSAGGIGNAVAGPAADAAVQTTASVPGGGGALTPAQRAWRDAEKSAAARRLDA
ncbi:crossover junction endodeoxyribonuclease RuvC [Ruicaihuangia caeni]|uniref:Crossover junction endodeoxyribonuclease RuvC n=1 Tax=Ruicaihuangia caeni TaxID=3042517 RepID=A0AAW6T2L5_9MICO|nr:crossover junction endodeoxyribonuclease RuvC [Klugiella sp. YN-L-19]MDI2098046.1 crossover junction endodeoxyribonuclease RuvC [Klugiella sp. YN-L-19]